eukprot:GEMP01026845.1.p1 GENE.GEMP01026845.1~~GEMP01026845.1.p1  ORF type:complete len:190 (+),score=28.01 GEMP01026845.1:153-722(+)
MGASPLTRIAPLNPSQGGDSTLPKRSYETPFSVRPSGAALVASSWTKFWTSQRIQETVPSAIKSENKSSLYKGSQSTQSTASNAWSCPCARDSKLDAWSPISCDDVHVREFATEKLKVMITNWYVCNKGSKTWPVFLLTVCGRNYEDCHIERTGPEVDKYLRDHTTRLWASASATIPRAASAHGDRAPR